ncbi:MAG: MaoC family dehydratase [Pelagibacterales bacterium]|nr:MaoC family dehydratase [Pelagibacterales bacterium]
MIYFEDLNIGKKILIGPISVSEKEIIEFAKKFDPQPFHVDIEKAKDSLFGNLCASGWHTCSLYMRMLYDGLLINLASLGSPGMNEIRWIKPLFPDETINGELTIISKTPSKSKPSIGSMVIDSKVFNSKKELIMTMQSISIVKKRNTE